ncbi:hypothetical protein ACSLO9_34230, partial [Escherichia coli]
MWREIQGVICVHSSDLNPFIAAKAAGVKTQRHQQYKSYSAESLIAANPEVIVVTSQMVDGDINRLR